MISTEEIKKLADLARIEVGEAELEQFRAEINPIIDYVSQVQEVAGEIGQEIILSSVFNVMRDDLLPTNSLKQNSELIAEFPESENNYLKVKKIL
ncbi:MAG TPA: Asp-tRNA(Asn)/Glu-tRNA(Gln) amidotransferase subunit GatC [Candidatus Paceibacterota bacterium]